MPNNLDKLTTAELEQRAISRHGNRAFFIATRGSKTGVPTRTGWISAINAPIDEYDEARQDEWEQSLDEKFPWLRQCRDAVQQREEIGQ
jgi:surfactin synthase thioesterase subunit